MRLNKYLAHAGICSRRKADELIALGEVTVNGKVVLEMGYKVAEKDKVVFEGKLIKPVKNFVYILLNKPRDSITTTTDTHGRKTVMDYVKRASTERLYPVGRLDRNTTGLLLLTNDGELAQKLSHPSYETQKVYHATLDRPLQEPDLLNIRKGVELEDGLAKVDDVAWVQGSGKQEVGIELHVGKNRIVRRIFEHLGYKVEKLDRVLYAGLTKKNLPRGKWRPLTEKEVLMLKHFK